MEYANYARSEFRQKNIQNGAGRTWYNENSKWRRPASRGMTSIPKWPASRGWTNKYKFSKVREMAPYIRFARYK